MLRWVFSTFEGLKVGKKSFVKLTVHPCTAVPHSGIRAAGKIVNLSFDLSVPIRFPTRQNMINQW